MSSTSWMEESASSATIAAVVRMFLQALLQSSNPLTGQKVRPTHLVNWIVFLNALPEGRHHPQKLWSLEEVFVSKRCCGDERSGPLGVSFYRFGRYPLELKS